MRLPVINWVISDKEILNSHFLGSYLNTSTFKVTIELWNNRFGVEQVQDITDGKLVIEFRDFEDSALLQHLQVKCDNQFFSKLEVDGTRGYLKLPKSLKGTPNNGSASCYENFVTIELTFAKDMPVKSDLKQLVFDVIY